MSEHKSSIDLDVQALHQLQLGASERVSPLIDEFHQKLIDISGKSFEATEEGYRDSFVLIDELQRTAEALRQTLVTDGDSPIFLARELPPVSENGKVLFSIRNFHDGERSKESVVEVPQLPTLSTTLSEANARGRFELEYEQEIEKFRLRIAELIDKTVEVLIAAEMNESDLRFALGDKTVLREKVDTMGKQIMNEINSEKKRLGCCTYILAKGPMKNMCQSLFTLVREASI